MIMLEKLTALDFTPHLHDHFTITLQDGQPYVLELVSVRELGEARQPTSRRPFSLHFINPRTDSYLGQRIYCLEHPQMGNLELFMVPLGPEQAVMRYEVIFA
jgi:hypothetical protein